MLILFKGVEIMKAYRELQSEQIGKALSPKVELNPIHTCYFCNDYREYNGTGYCHNDGEEFRTEPEDKACSFYREA
jgi:hypothetical protein